jgi:hypothetical protein
MSAPLLRGSNRHEPHRCATIPEKIKARRAQRLSIPLQQKGTREIGMVVWMLVTIDPEASACFEQLNAANAVKVRPVRRLRDVRQFIAHRTFPPT